MNNVTLLHGDCLDHLRALPANSVDSVVCDPPYELGFMGRAWDATGIAYQVDLWREVARVLKPGGHLVAFGGTRTYHRMVCAIEDAGLEIRDSLHWVYGSGFPKSLDISKALDKAAGAERTVTGPKVYGDGHIQNNGGNHNRNAYGNYTGDNVPLTIMDTAPATDLAARWAGWGTALKPAHEPIVLARKPLAGTVAATVATWGTGGINIDACRVETTDNLNGGAYSPSVDGMSQNAVYGRYYKQPGAYEQPAGRWPPNVLLTHSAACNGHCAPDCPVAALDAQAGPRKSGGGVKNKAGHSIGLLQGVAAWKFAHDGPAYEASVGSASRFFPVLAWDPATDVPFLYVPKASRAERNAGCAGLPEVVNASHIMNRMRCQTCGGWQATGPQTVANRPHSTCQCEQPDYAPQPARVQAQQNTHPTVKPVALMRWLVRLVTPPGGTVLDPFLGSGTTGIAAVHEGMGFIGMEQDESYLTIAQARIAAVDPLFQEVAS